jgi:hypothetical protein
VSILDVVDGQGRKATKRYNREAPHIRSRRRVFVEDSPAIVVDADGKRRICSKVVPQGTSVLCVRYDGTVEVVPLPQQQQQQHGQAYKTG